MYLKRYIPGMFLTEIERLRIHYNLFVMKRRTVLIRLAGSISNKRRAVFCHELTPDA